MKVVVVEDNLTLQRSIQKFLEKAEHNVQAFVDGEEARQFIMIENESVDLCIVDYMLPSLDEIELIKAVRAEGVTTPMLMLTTLVARTGRVVLA